MVEMLLTQDCDRQVAKALVFGFWSCCSQPAGTISHPKQLGSRDSNWIHAAVPGTVASALASAGQWDMQHPPAIDSLDWWYRSTFTNPDHGHSDDPIPTWLTFDGLATLCEIWLNDELLMQTDNMFRGYRFDISRHLLEQNELVLGFRSISADLQTKRPRPRWKTNLVNHQALRWRRTSLLGRIPGWSPPVPTIGPWRQIRLEQSPVTVSDIHLHTALDGTTGVVALKAVLHSTEHIESIRLLVGSEECQIEVARDRELEANQTPGDCEYCLSGRLRMADVSLWWPHTHGEQPLYACRLMIQTAKERYEIDCGSVGFRQLRIDQTNGFSIEVNGQPIYARGACRTVSDVFLLDGSEESLRRDLTLVRDSGANMLRVIGTMAYESDLFYRLCDELGIMVWQDFMFANMDYPVDDPSFAENIAAEAVEQLQRLASHASVIIYCGNSEVEQQAAMLGMPREVWSNRWFTERLPALCRENHSGTAYIPSTPTGGVLPFHPESGVSHYYGIGAYLRSPSELRQADVKFTPECLGFANIPEPETIQAITNGAAPVVHHPNWKQRVPRDSGAGWDFEDVRDHYLKQVYNVDPTLLRSSDMPRYLELSRVVSGEMMARTFSEWRSGHSHNRGGLVWFFKDLWPAAGWGVVDSTSMPKAAYYYLKRTWNSRQITLTDEGLNGLHLHAINESAQALSGFIEVTLLKEPNVIIAREQSAIQLPARGKITLSADEILGRFYDVSYAYRFGPPHHDVVIVSLLDGDRQVISEAYHFIRRRESNMVPAAVDAVAQKTSNSDYQLTLQTDRFLHNVRLSAVGYLPNDNYFHLAPQHPKLVRFTSVAGSQKSFRAEVEALNLETPVTVTFHQNRE